MKEKRSFVIDYLLGTAPNNFEEQMRYRVFSPKNGSLPLYEQSDLTRIEFKGKPLYVSTQPLTDAAAEALATCTDCDVWTVYPPAEKQSGPQGS